MGLKDDIYNAFEKNLGKDFVDATSEGKKKVDDLAEDISNAIQTFLLAQEFRVDKLSAPVFIKDVSVSNATPIPAPGPTGGRVVPSLTPISLQGSAPGIPFIDSTADVDVNGQTTNGSLLGKFASDNSLVKLRVVKKGSE